jgi:two-component system chemotaxis response regulator CheB
MATESPTPSERPTDVCVIGASAGGVQALQTVLGRLPADHRGSVLVVLHLTATAPSLLADILGRACALPCETARDGEPLTGGRVWVAPPDQHLRVEDGRVRLDAGPRENGHRPSVDVLFRSAADALGPRVLGVVLSGTRDDGTAGLAEIKRRDGVGAVQDPDDALHPGMPRSALDHVAVDVVADAAGLGDLIASAAVQRRPRASLGGGASITEDTTGDLLSIVCPECGGTLQEELRAGVTTFACHVGHRYAPASLIVAQADAVERALWTAVRALEDRALLLRDMAGRAERDGRANTARSWRVRAARADADVRVLRDALGRQTAFETQVPAFENDT